VALTAVPEPALRRQLEAGTARLPQPAQLSVAQVPAEVLAQRPDLFTAERDLAAAGAEVTEARAQRYPRITLAGSIAPIRLDVGGVSANGTVWSVGPVTVTLPIFDGGVRRANADAAQARLNAAASNYAASLRTAVREVEEALIALQSTAARGADAGTAAVGFERSYRAVEARYKGGLASLFELEDARRSAVAAQSALIDLQRERVAAWISLYRALGGGWTATDARADAGTSPRS
jgi:outer membrane protein TolC